jgi:succinate dehydrogenase/fumarate reductase flavoprotein subunit
MAREEGYDLIVLGGGAAGLTAGITGAAHGLKVLLLEASPQVGGTTATSAGALWVPNSALAAGAGDDPEQAAVYLRATVGDRVPQEITSAFLQRGPEMIGFLEELGATELFAFPHHPDYISNAPGATTWGRVLGPRPFNARVLGANLAKLRVTLPEFTIFGGMAVDRTDIGHLLGAHRSLKSFLHAATITLRFGWDKLTGGRGTRLVMGNALAGRLLASALKLGVEVRTRTTVTALMREGAQVTGVVADGTEIRARRGVVLATGGFPYNQGLRDALYPQPVATYSAAPATNRGGGVELGLSAGGQLSLGHANTAFWAPSSVRKRSDGSTAVFPHFFLDRGKPGIIAVRRDGRRFVNETTSYQRFVEGMYAADAIPCWMICNGQFIRKYGLGVIRPRTTRLKSFLEDGYIVEGATLSELAAKLGIDAAGLSESVAANDRFAQTGGDTDFGRGTGAYSRNLGDSAHGPNPCIGPIGSGPYYALTIQPADIGTSVGLVTDATARVLDGSGTPVEGLYAAGNDMSSVMGGVYPGPGVTLGPAMTFGYVAALHAATAREDRV